MSKTAIIAAKSAMHVDVSNILQQGEGSRADFSIVGETPELVGIDLAAPLTGELRVVGTTGGVVIRGRLHTDVTLHCRRCLRAFSHHLDFPLQGEFSRTPVEDQFSIDKYGKIDLSEPVRQEIEVHLPLAPLCQEGCDGIELKQKKDS